MLNKFFIIYASIMFTMVLSVMFLLISAEVADIAIAQKEAMDRVEACKALLSELDQGAYRSMGEIQTEPGTQQDLLR